MNAVLPTAFRSLLMLAARRLASRRKSGHVAGEPQGRIRNRKLHAMLAVLGLVYAVWPLDLIPDVVPLLGWVDDGLALLFAFQQARRATEPNDQVD